MKLKNKYLLEAVLHSPSKGISQKTLYTNISYPYAMISQHRARADGNTRYVPLSLTRCCIACSKASLAMSYTGTDKLCVF